MSNANRRVPARHRRGAMMVLIAICLPLLIIMAAFAIDVAWMQLARTELRTATDAAARAGAKELSLKQSEGSARATAKTAAARNLVAGKPLVLADSDIQVGKSTQAGSGRFKFTAGSAQPNAVRVTGNRTNSSKGGAVDLLFSGVLGVDEFEPVEVATSTHLDRDICLVVDRSGSMMRGLFGSDVPGGNCKPPHPTKSRWGNLANALKEFVDELEKTPQEELCGLVSYSSNATSCGQTYRISEINSELTNDYGVIRQEMQKKSDAPVEGRTAISAGIDDGIKVLTSAKSRPFALRTMVLMTDGIHNTGPEPVLSARAAALQNIVIHTVTFSVDADIRRMQDVAEATGGRHFHADDQAELVNIFKEIAATLPVMLTE